MKNKICISLLYMISFLSLAGCMEPMEIPGAIPQERMRWQNPEGFGMGLPLSDRDRCNTHGWGLEPETEPYSRVFMLIGSREAPFSDPETGGKEKE